MSTFTIPNSQGQTRQDNRGDTRGELWETFNIDLTTKLGKILSSKGGQQALNITDDLDGDRPVALSVYKAKYYVTTSNNSYTCNIDNDPADANNWAKDTTLSGAVSGSMDSTFFDGDMIISRGSNMDRWDGSALTSAWWSSVSGTLASGDYHALHTHRGGQETIFVTDGNLVKYYNTTAGHSTVTLNASLTASCIDSGVNAVWVGTYTENSDSAYVYEIHVGEQADGAPVARNAFKVEGRAVLSISVIDNVPYIITDRGNLQAFNGAGFTTIAQLPMAFTDEQFQSITTYSVPADPNDRPIHPKGMQPYNDSIYININTEKVNGDYPMRTPSGIWEYNKTTGQFNNRFSLSDSASSNGLVIITT